MPAEQRWILFDWYLPSQHSWVWQLIRWRKNDCVIEARQVMYILPPPGIQVPAESNFCFNFDKKALYQLKQSTKQSFKVVLIVIWSSLTLSRYPMNHASTWLSNLTVCWRLSNCWNSLWSGKRDDYYDREAWDKYLGKIQPIFGCETLHHEATGD